MMDESHKEKEYSSIYNAISLILQSRKIMLQQISTMKQSKVPIDDILQEIDGLPVSGETQGFEILDIIKKHCS
jgi:hypothetical protein